MCTFCQIARGDESQSFTPWYYLGLPGEVEEEDLQGVIFQDPDCDDCAARLIWVPRKHSSKGNSQTRRIAVKLLMPVAQAFAVNYDLVVVGFDFKVLDGHWCAQVLFDFPEETPIGLLCILR